MYHLLDILVFFFIVLVAPLWLALHYGIRFRQSKALTADNERLLGELADLADRLEDRIGNLERMLGEPPMQARGNTAGGNTGGGAEEADPSDPSSRLRKVWENRK